MAEGRKHFCDIAVVRKTKGWARWPSFQQEPLGIGNDFYQTTLELHGPSSISESF
jgi:hypothetical protein